MYLLLIVLLLSQLHCNSIANYQKIRTFRSKNRDGFYLQMYIGNPPQKQIMSVDTGSDLMNIKCAQCKECKAVQKLYQSKQSITSQSILCNAILYQCENRCYQDQPKQECSYSLNYLNYQAGSKGVIRKDRVDFSQNPSEDYQFQVEFSCSTSMKGTLLSDTYSNGVLGLSPGSFYTFIRNWFTRKGQNIPKIMGLCFEDEEGYMQLGDSTVQKNINQNVATSQYIPLEPGLVTTLVSQIKMGELDLYQKAIWQKGVLLDTGATRTCISPQKYNQLLDMMDKICAKYSDYCSIYQRPQELSRFYLFSNISPFETTQDYLDKIFPILNVTINQTIISTKPSNYMLKTRVRSIYALGFRTFNSSATSFGMILGLPWFIDKKITINMDRLQIQVRSNFKCVSEQNTFVYQSKVTLSTVISYIALLLIFVIIVFIPNLAEFFNKIKTKILRKKNELIEQQTDKEELTYT